MPTATAAVVQRKRNTFIRVCLAVIAAATLAVASAPGAQANGDAFIATLAGTGSLEFNGDGPAAQADINPGYMVFDPHSGELYFSDGTSNPQQPASRIRVLYTLSDIRPLKQRAAETVYDRVEQARTQVVALEVPSGLLSIQQLTKLSLHQREAYRLYTSRLSEYESRRSPETDDLLAKSGSLRAWVRQLKHQRLDERNRAAQARRELEAQQAKLRIKIKRPAPSAQTKRDREDARLEADQSTRDRKLGKPEGADNEYSGQEPMDDAERPG